LAAWKHDRAPGRGTLDEGIEKELVARARQLIGR
jgi:hypothetical protein